MPSRYSLADSPSTYDLGKDVRIGGIYGTKEAALEAAAVAGSFSFRDGQGIQINVPEDPTLEEGEPSKWDDLLRP